MRAIDAWVEHPPSVDIARRLNAKQAEVCDHDRDPCLLRCGVRRDHRGHWIVIGKGERVAWRRKALGK